MTDYDYSVRTMTRNELDIAIDWAAKEGWNPGLYDGDCFYSADPSGFFIGLSGDEPVATISAVKYGASFGFMGFYIVKPEYRGKGCGIGIWNAGLKYLQGRNIGLDGVVQQQENYMKSGFSLAWRNMRHEGRSKGEVFPRHPEILALSDVPVESVYEYDRSFFPAGRAAFLKCWINQDGCKALGYMRDGVLGGYGVIRRCRHGYKIGPLFADGENEAEALFTSLISGIGASEAYYLDTPESNRDAVSLARAWGMEVMFETARMYTGKVPDIPLNRLFGVTSFELG